MFAIQLSQSLSLELLTPDHADAIFALTEANRDSLGRWLAWVEKSTSVAATHAFIRGCQEDWLEDRGYHVAIRHQGRVVGVAEHHSISTANRSTELGYWLETASQGQGIVNATCRYLCEDAFTRMKMHRVRLRTGVDNTRSRKVAERLGFKLEGVAREAELVGGVFLDCALYGLLAHEWKATG